MPLPKDPFILLSYLNTQLRDRYASLEQLCEDMAVSPAELCQTMQTIGYTYSPAHNQFIRS